MKTGEAMREEQSQEKGGRGRGRGKEGREESSWITLLIVCCLTEPENQREKSHFLPSVVGHACREKRGRGGGGKEREKGENEQEGEN